MSSLTQPVMGIFAYPRRKVNSDRTAKAALGSGPDFSQFPERFRPLEGPLAEATRLTTGDVHPNWRSLKERSLAVNLRHELGHWEGALAVGKQNKATFVASVERKSRLLRVSWISKLQFRSLPH
jgi:hypothetical protein